jgi:hypothetical protein
MQFHADKIRDEWTDRFLTLEFQPHEAAGAQVIPKPLLGFGLIGAEKLGMFEQANPLSPRGEGLELLLLRSQ